MSLKGEIEVGDGDKFASILKKNDDQIFKETLCLNSPGGNYTEALHIIRAILDRGGVFRTLVDKDSECLSACALIFLAGFRHLGDGAIVPNRVVSISAKLGFHAPYLSAAGAVGSNSVAALLYREGVEEAIGELLSLTAEDSQRETLFPRSLLAEALKRLEPNDFFYIDIVDKAGRWDIDIVGHAMPSTLTLKMVRMACSNREAWKLFATSASNLNSTTESATFRIE